MRHLFLSSAAAVALLATPIHAADLAMIVANENYDVLPDVSRGDDAAQASEAFRARGFQVLTRSDATAADILDGLADFAAAAPLAERVVVILTGRFVQSDRETWLLPIDSRAPTLAALPRGALPLSLVMTVLANHPGRAVLLLGPDDDSGAVAPYLTAGVGPLDVPQGVTVLTGSPRAVAGFAGDTLAQPGAVLATAAARAGLGHSGFLSPDLVLIPRTGDAPGLAEQTAEAAFWQAITQQDTESAYLAYLDRYPDGPNAAEARSRIAAIRSDPARLAAETEAALALSRDARREIQRDLSLLGYNTRGIDGIFGAGTRGAIGNWQGENAYQTTGYLTRDQIQRLDAQAERRAAELEAEAEARRAQQEQQDRAYWAETGAAGDEPGLRAYLNRYPDGVFAEVAQDRLAVIESEKRQQAAAQDRAAWDHAVQIDTARAYQDYLIAFPQGAFASEANARLTILNAQAENADEEQVAIAAEQALHLDLFTRRLIEQRLSKMGFKPGSVDGTFDDHTRRAIRRYQSSRDMTPTGYLNEDTVVQIMADTLFGR